MTVKEFCPMSGQINSRWSAPTEGAHDNDPEHTADKTQLVDEPKLKFIAARGPFQI